MQIYISKIDRTSDIQTGQNAIPPPEVQKHVGKIQAAVYSPLYSRAAAVGRRKTNMQGDEAEWTATRPISNASAVSTC